MQVYMSVWLANPSVRPALSKLYNTWQRYFPEDVLTTISQRQNAPEQVLQARPITCAYLQSLCLRSDCKPRSLWHWHSDGLAPSGSAILHEGARGGGGTTGESKGGVMQAPPELRQPHYPSAAPSGQQQYQHQAPYAAHEAPRQVLLPDSTRAMAAIRYNQTHHMDTRQTCAAFVVMQFRHPS